MSIGLACWVVLLPPYFPSLPLSWEFCYFSHKLNPLLVHPILSSDLSKYLALTGSSCPSCSSIYATCYRCKHRKITPHFFSFKNKAEIPWPVSSSLFHVLFSFSTKRVTVVYNPSFLSVSLYCTLPDAHLDFFSGSHGIHLVKFYNYPLIPWTKINPSFLNCFCQAFSHDDKKSQVPCVDVTYTYCHSSWAHCFGVWQHLAPQSQFCLSRDLP